MTSKYIKPKTENDIDGILHHYRDAYNIIPSSTNRNTPRIQFIIDGVIDANDWCSNDTESSYLDLNFYEGYSLLLYSYTFVVREGGPDKEIPQSWIVSGYTGSEWINLDQKIKFKANTDFRHFNTTSASIPLSKIRFKQTDQNLLGNYHFCIREIELFGILTKNSDLFSCNEHYIGQFSVLKSLLTSILVYIPI